MFTLRTVYHIFVCIVSTKYTMLCIFKGGVFAGFFEIRLGGSILYSYIVYGESSLVTGVGGLTLSR